MATVDPTFAAVEDVYLSFQDRLDHMLLSCADQDERDQINGQFAAAEEKYYDCVDESFAANDAELDQLVIDAHNDAQAIRDIDAQLGSFAKVLNVATQAAVTVEKIAEKILTV